LSVKKKKCLVGVVLTKVCFWWPRRGGFFGFFAPFFWKKGEAGGGNETYKVRGCGCGRKKKRGHFERFGGGGNEAVRNPITLHPVKKVKDKMRPPVGFG